MEKKLSSKYIHMYMSISRVFIRLTGNVLKLFPFAMAPAQEQERQHHCASQRCHLGNKSGKRKTRTSPDKNILRVANCRQ